MTKFQSLTVVFCAVNEETALLDAAKTALDAGGADIGEIIVVLSAGATPGCHAAAERLREIAPVSVTVQVQPEPGLGSAIQEGFRAASCTHTVVLPADFDLDITRLSDMIKLSKAHPDAIITVSRWLPGGGMDGYGRFKRIPNRLTQLFISLLFHTHCTDYTCGTQICPTELLRRIRWENRGPAIVMEMALKPLRLGTEFFEVPCRYIKRREGESHIRPRQLLSYYKAAVKIRLMKKGDIENK